MAKISGAGAHSAAGQYLGYSLQTVRLATRLLLCVEGASVSLEYLDDVAVHRADGLILLEQDKSGLSHNPLTDWSVDLWKTLSIWVERAQADEQDLIKRYILYVTPPAGGIFATMLHETNSVEAVSLLVEKIAGDFKALSKVPKCAPFLEKFLDADATIQHRIVSRMHVESDDDDPVQAIRHHMSTSIQPELLQDVSEAIIGMAKEEADRLIRRGEPAIIDGDDFKRRVRTVVRRSVHPGLLPTLGGDPSAEEIAGVLTRRPTFIRQLEIIALGQEDQFRAVSDFLRSSADRTHWAETGEIFEGSLTDWDDGLLRHFAMISGEISDTNSSQGPEAMGRITYRRCSLVQAPLEGRVVPSHFVHGSFNNLADRRRLGWHPEYESLLSVKVEADA